MKVKPKRDNVLVKVEKEDKQTKSGIVVVENETSKQSPDRGTVIEVGEGRYLNNGTLIPTSVVPGDHIIFQKFAGTEIKVEEEVYLMIKENDILATVEGM